MTRFGVVLSSGGTRGVYAHTGFMEALAELGIDVSAAAGCSAGAVVGGIYASGTDPAAWRKAITGIPMERFWAPPRLWSILPRLVFSRGRGITGLADTDAAIAFLASLLGVQRFEDCRYPFSAVTVCLDTVEKVLLREGPLATGMMASAAMPGYYRPVEIDGRCYCDGAVYELAPVEAICCRHRLDVLLIHHVQHQDFTPAGLERALRQPWTILELMRRLVFRQRPWYATGRPIGTSRCPCGCRAVIVVVEPALPDLPWPATEGGEGVLASAREHGLRQLGPILATLRRDPRALLA